MIRVFRLILLLFYTTLLSQPLFPSIYFLSLNIPHSFSLQTIFLNIKQVLHLPPHLSEVLQLRFRRILYWLMLFWWTLHLVLLTLLTEKSFILEWYYWNEILSSQFSIIWVWVFVFFSWKYKNMMWNMINCETSAF